MSSLVAIAYADQGTAERVKTALMEMQRDFVLQLDDLVVVTRPEDGKVKVHQTTSLPGAGVGGGALVGSAIGLLFLAPIVGAAIGAAAGGAAHALGDSGVNDKFMRELGERLDVGGAAVIVLVRSSIRDRVLPRLRKFGGHLLEADLTDEQEDSLRLALTDRAAD